MVAQDYWAHDNPEGKTPWAFILAAGYNYETAGENLAYGFDTSEDTLTAWMNSPEHRANILNTTYTDVGFGIANSANFQGTGPETIVVAEYASPAVAAATPVTSTPTSAATPTTTATTPTPTPTPTPTVANTAPVATTPTPSPTATPVAKSTVSNTPQTSKSTGVTQKDPAPQSISRIQLLASSEQTPWSAFAISTIAAVSLAIFLLRHGLMWHRYLVKGERFIMKHKLLDIALVALGVVGILLTQSAGVIR